MPQKPVCVHLYNKGTNAWGSASNRPLCSSRRVHTGGGLISGVRLNVPYIPNLACHLHCDVLRRRQRNRVSHRSGISHWCARAVNYNISIKYNLSNRIFLKTRISLQWFCTNKHQDMLVLILKKNYRRNKLQINTDTTSARADYPCAAAANISAVCCMRVVVRRCRPYESSVTVDAHCIAECCQIWDLVSIWTSDLSLRTINYEYIYGIIESFLN